MDQRDAEPDRDTEVQRHPDHFAPAYDAIRMCFLEISEAAIKFGALAELHEPGMPWSAIRGFGNHLRHTYDEMDLNAIERAVDDLGRPDAACMRAVERIKTK